jgi:hypothetical protein
MSINTHETLAGQTRAPKRINGFRFEVSDVTDTHRVDVADVPPETPVAAVAKALAARMELPQNTAWALRENGTGSYLDDQRPIGEQVEDQSRLSLIPKAHLG